MVDLRQPDLSRYPRFSQALEASQEAYLEPGDALYIPTLWWHSVESLDSINVLVNYWWTGAQSGADSPFLSLLYGISSISQLPVEQREAWRNFFDQFVFQIDSDPAAHLPANMDDILGTLSIISLCGWFTRARNTNSHINHIASSILHRTQGTGEANGQERQLERLEAGKAQRRRLAQSRDRAQYLELQHMAQRKNRRESQSSTGRLRDTAEVE